MGIRSHDWWDGSIGRYINGQLSHTTIPKHRAAYLQEYRFNKCKQCERVLKSRIRPHNTIRGKEWYWHCYMCLNMQRYPK